jgi:hypothetical protein
MAGLPRALVHAALDDHSVLAGSQWAAPNLVFQVVAPLSGIWGFAPLRPAVSVAFPSRSPPNWVESACLMASAWLALSNEVGVGSDVVVAVE